jgi:hypothetical protein
MTRTNDNGTEDTSHEDVLELLRQANPIHPEMLPDPGDSVIAKATFERITGTPYDEST